MTKTSVEKKSKSAPTSQKAEELVVQTVPLGRLVAWEGNVRKTDSAVNLGELKSSIVAQGVLTSLVARQKGTFFEVIAGGRRLAALDDLREEGGIDDDYPVPCRIIACTDAEAEEISLTENIVREPLHPADEFEAFHALAESGATIDDIAARFGTSPTVVKKRLTLAANSPKVMQAFRNGRIGLAEVQAFAVTTDHKRQNRLLDGSETLHADYIRRSLTEGKISASDRRVKFVGLSAYKEAGGTCSEDLFVEDVEGIFIEDAELLSDLARQELQRREAEIKAEGWSWVTASIEPLSYADKNQYQQQPYKTVELSKAVALDLKDLEKELATLHEKDESGEILTDAEFSRMQEIDEKIGDIEERKKSWTDKTKSACGVLIGLNSDGSLEIVRGLMSIKEAKKAERALKKSETSSSTVTAEDDDSESADADTPEMSAKLLQDLSTHRTAALADGVQNSPLIALMTVVYTLALDTFYQYPKASSCLTLAGDDTWRTVVSGKGTYKGLDALTVVYDEWLTKVPEDEAALWGWVMAQEQDTLLKLLAHLTARRVTDISQGGRRGAHADQLAEATDTVMTRYFKPTVDNLFGRMNKRQLIAAITEINPDLSPSIFKKMKADVLATLAEEESREAEERGHPWLPQPLRAPTPKKEV